MYRPLMQILFCGIFGAGRIVDFIHLFCCGVREKRTLCQNPSHNVLRCSRLDPAGGMRSTSGDWTRTELMCSIRCWIQTVDNPYAGPADLEPWTGGARFRIGAACRCGG